MERAEDPWITEFDVIHNLKSADHNLKIIGVKDLLKRVDAGDLKTQRYKSNKACDLKTAISRKMSHDATC